MAATAGHHERAALAARLSALEDREAVAAALRRYSRAIDAGEEAEWVDCFLLDGRFLVESDVAGYPQRRFEGAAELARFIASHSAPPAAHHKHLYLLPEIEVDGDEARADGYFVHLLDRGGRPVMLSYGRYADRLRRCPDGRWRLVERRAAVEASEDRGGASVLGLATGDGDSEASGRFICGVDIGGTFTDCVAMDERGRVTLAKTSSTPPDFGRGFLGAVTEVAGRLGLGPEEFLARTDLVLHGTTVGTNVLVQMRGARTGLITTRGHGDALIIMRSYGRSAGLPLEELLHISRHRKPDPIVPRSLIREVSERIDYAGEVILPLNEDEARAAAAELRDKGVESIAISLLWGFQNPAHERRLREIVEAEAPGVYVTCAHELIAKPGEYERTAGTAINAFIGPSTSSYVRRIDAALSERGYANELLIMQAAGGVVPAAEAARRPLFTIGSGPVGGVTGAAYLAAQNGHSHVLAGDMGGTSYDVGLIADGAPLTSSDTVINQYTFFMPRLDIESIGSGGGSIVWIDEESGTLRVGPESAGADPGPAAYGRGGERPTITDCNLVLGRFDPDAFASSGLSLSRERALAAVTAVAERVGMDAVEAAAGALRIVESQMAALMRQLTIGRGHDPRDFVVYSFGGAGGAHAVQLARELGCAQVLVPLGDLASTWSALGVMTADVIHVHEHAQLLTAPFAAAEINAVLERLDRQAREQLAAEGFEGEDAEVTFSAQMKFSLQIHELEVPLPPPRLADADAEELVERFIAQYERTYGAGSAYRAAGTQIGLFRAVAKGRLETPRLPEIAPGTPRPIGRREVYWPEASGFAPTAVFGPEGLGAGASVDGPAVLQLPETTVVLPPGSRAEVDARGSIVIEVGGGAAPVKSEGAAVTA